MKNSVCIDMMFSYCDFYDRFKKVKDAGINAVEFWKWSNKNIDKVKMLLREYDMSLSVFNLDSKDESLSYDLSRGIINDGRAKEFLEAIEESCSVYKTLDAEAIIVLVGENKPFNPENIMLCLNAAIPVLESENINLIIEPLNSIDRKGYSMPYAAPISELIKSINNPHIKMLYDIYHQNMMGDFSLDFIKENIDLIGHFHVADCPGRHQPGTGNINYSEILKFINGLPYKGYIGLEYRSTMADEKTLFFLQEAKECIR